jgi:hypothetical protein
MSNNQDSFIQYVKRNKSTIAVSFTIWYIICIIGMYIGGNNVIADDVNGEKKVNIKKLLLYSLIAAIVIPPVVLLVLIGMKG